jgi:hypothetical protein
MHARRVVLVVTLALAAVTVARSGHELPVYPSYYPHEIEIATLSPERAADLLAEGKLHAYVGSEPRFAGTAPEQVVAVESLGAFLVVRVNPLSPLAKDEASACVMRTAVLHRVAASGGDFVVHPYPVTPLHGDYLYHIDRAEAAKEGMRGDGSRLPAAGIKVKAEGFAATLVPADWRAPSSEWDIEVAEVATADLLARNTTMTNGWQGPPWLRTGWFHARLLLAGAGRPSDRVGEMIELLEADAFASPAERINAERNLVAALTQGCHAAIVGYRVRREFMNIEFSTGIENIGFDALTGLHSPMFLRTVKLKDFPWNGWLALGVQGRPEAAWNPIAGFTDAYGRLMWSALGDPAAIPSPYDSAWMLNRISDVDTSGRR